MKHHRYAELMEIKGSRVQGYEAAVPLNIASIVRGCRI